MTNFKHEEYLSRQRAAERLVDIAYSLTAGGTLELRTGADHVKVPVVDQVLLTRESRTDGDRVLPARAVPSRTRNASAVRIRVSSPASSPQTFLAAAIAASRSRYTFTSWVRDALEYAHDPDLAPLAPRDRVRIRLPVVLLRPRRTRPSSSSLPVVRQDY